MLKKPAESGVGPVPRILSDPDVQLRSRKGCHEPLKAPHEGWAILVMVAGRRWRLRDRNECS